MEGKELPEGFETLRPKRKRAGDPPDPLPGFRACIYGFMLRQEGLSVEEAARKVRERYPSLRRHPQQP